MASKYAGNATFGTNNEYTKYTSTKLSRKTKTYPEIRYKQITDTTEFIQHIEENKRNTDPTSAWRVDTPTSDNLKDVDMYITNNGSTFGINRKTHTMVALSSARDEQGNSLDNMRAINEVALQKGGTNFDSFEGNWDFYLHNGYVPTGWVNWDSQYNNYMMGQGWRPEYGTERVIWFEHNPTQAKEMIKQGITVNEWATGDNYKRFDTENEE